MGSTLNPDDIKEGDDVYFECHVHANPRPYKMSWYHDVSKNLMYCTSAHIHKKRYNSTE